MKKLLLGIGVLIGISSYAQDGTFSLSGQYRPRMEVRNGFKKPILDNENPAAFMEQRTRIIAMYKNKDYGFKTSFQDIRIWGEVGQINKSDQLLSVHEAYGEYYASPKSTFRIGRQEMAYDGHRFIGTLNWAAQARAFDAVKYMYEDTVGNSFHAFASWNQSGYGDGAPEPAKLTGNNYTIGTGGGTNRIFNLGLPKAQLFLWYQRKFSGGDVSFMINNDVNQTTASSTHSKYTLGLTPNFTFGGIKVGGQFYYTGGQVDDDVDYSSIMANVYVQSTKAPGKPLLGFDYLSGDDGSDASKSTAWSPDYGTNHKFYGFMDYFYVGNGHSNAGLMDVYLKTTFKLGEKSKLLGHLHYFMDAIDVVNPDDASTMSSGLGTEIDLVYVKPVASGVLLKVGYSAMFTTETMNVIKYGATDPSASPVSSWGWVMIDFTPNFL